MAHKKGYVNLFYIMFLFISVNIYADKSDRVARVTPTVRAVAQVLPSVININTAKLAESFNGREQSRQDHLFGHNPEQLRNGTGKGYSLGSGTIVDPYGLAVTNAHVVSRAVQINVTLSNGLRCEAKVIAQDEINDLALLRITAIPANTVLKAVPMAEPGDLLLGETVIVVGNPFGLGSSISRGVLSAIGRKVSYKDRVVFADLLQSDAAIYPGNSGGPLINLNGRMIGITTAILKGTEDINFAIPLERVENTLARWLIPERFRPVSLGLIPGVKRLQDGRLFFFVREVVKDSPSWKAGIKPGAEIIRFNGMSVRSLIRVGRVLWRLQLGSEITLTLNDNKEYRVKIEDQRLASGRNLCEMKLGISVRPLTDTLARALNYPFRGGMLVSGVRPGIVLKGVNRGSLLLRVGDTLIHDEKNLAQVLWSLPPGRMIPAEFISVVKREGKYYFVRKKLNIKVR
jgi:S1-C subfamily serine protease